MSWLRDVMSSGMDLFYAMSGNYGVAIILVTLAIKIVLLPFSFIEIKTRLRMQAIQPEVKELQAKYKDDPQRLNRETMELWKKHGVNPLSGCLPMLLQFPFLIAFWQMLHAYNYAENPSFLWLNNLGVPDPLYIMPVLAALTTWMQTKVAGPAMGGGAGADQTQRTMTLMMPLLLGWFATRFPSGLSLYWVASNVFGVLQQLAPTLRPSGTKGEEG